ncbi:Rha family transcriptional regulator [Brevibacillus sp. AG]|uniref:Rha family transcriptional regulator n=1 Tax=Brevibacillus sp. AG TaxID=3020891 RepID=UPI00232C06AF|nr:Rha family transcriptional regulator [Brevibacillus sp. AG]MDC0763464.1 Rha family transcriptional regulator [Brevibacillus sp. AG]
MKDLVFVEQGRVVTDSLIVASTFGKNHADVLRDIRNLGCSKEFRLSNFAESSYTNQQGRQMPKIDMTRDGFTFLVMGYTGKEADRFKEDYIKAFNLLEQQLRSNYPQMSQLEIVAHLALQAVQKEKEDARRDQEIQSLKSGIITLTENLTAIPDAAKVVDLVNEYARWTRIGHNEIYNRVYDIMKDQHGIDVPLKVKNEREKVNQAQIAAKGKPYAESTLKSKVNGIDVMVRNGWLEKFSVILASLLAQEKANALPVFEG